MKSISPQAKVKQIAEMMYPDAEVEVAGRRPPARGGKKYKYQAAVVVDGKYVAFVEERNWRMAYKSLEIALSKSAFQ